MEPDLWQPPPPPAPGQDRWNVVDAALYGKLSQRILKCWSTDVLKSIPQELRKKTPFSLEMLKQITELAGFTKGNMAEAHDLLKLRWQHRQEVAHLEAGAEEWVTTRREGRRHKQTYVQSSRENRLGLMIQDVKGAMSEVKREANFLARSGKARSAKNMKDAPSGTEPASKRERARQALSGVMKQARKKDVEEVDDALVGFSLQEGRVKQNRTRRQIKMAQRTEIASRKEGHAELPLDRLKLGALPVRSAAEVDSERMMSSLASLSHAGPDPRNFEFRTDAIDEMDEDEDEDEDDDNDGGVSLNLN